MSVGVCGGLSADERHGRWRPPGRGAGNGGKHLDDVPPRVPTVDRGEREYVVLSYTRAFHDQKGDRRVPEHKQGWVTRAGIKMQDLEVMARWTGAAEIIIKGVTKRY